MLFTDKTGFAHDGIMNLQNQHLFADVNPHGMISSWHQEGLGGHNRKLVGRSSCFPAQTDRSVYHDFLRSTLLQLLEDVPLQTSLCTWFIHNGAPPHFSITVRTFFSDKYLELWVGQGGPIAWPIKSLT
jgi:hypothetical protein